MGPPPGRGDHNREQSSATDELSPVSIQSLDHHPSGEDLSPGMEEESNFKQLMLQVKEDPVLATSGLSEGFYYKVCIMIRCRIHSAYWVATPSFLCETAG